MGLQRREVLAMPLGDVLDLMAARAIANGAATEKQQALSGWDAAMRAR
jgi:hypothetical protein